MTHRPFRHGRRDVDEQRHRAQPGQQTQYEQRPPDNLDHAYERTGEIRQRDTNLGKSSRAPLSDKDKLLDPIGEEYAAGEQSNKNDGGRSIRPQQAGCD